MFSKAWKISFRIFQGLEDPAWAHQENAKNRLKTAREGGHKLTGAKAGRFVHSRAFESEYEQEYE
jgi:hypothetical protein